MSPPPNDAAAGVACGVSPPWLVELLACPRDEQPLTVSGDRLTCPRGHAYPIVRGVPVLLLDEAAPTIELAATSLRQAHGGWRDDRGLYVESLGLTDAERRGVERLAADGTSRVDPAVAFLVGATGGYSYKHLIGALDEYPIPAIRLPRAAGRLLLDIGCSWGRWCIAAARRGYRPVGVDPSLGAILAASRVARELDVDAAFVVGDARFLPFRRTSFDAVFSYSVLQHLDPAAVESAIAQIARVLKARGASLVQMPTRFGVRCLYHQARRRFREPTGFEVRYWSRSALRRAFRRIGPTRLDVDCFFGIGLQWADRRLLPLSRRLVVACSEALRRAGTIVPPLGWVADSVFVSSVKDEGGER